MKDSPRQQVELFFISRQQLLAMFSHSQGQSLPIHPALVPINIRYASNSYLNIAVPRTNAIVIAVRLHPRRLCGMLDLCGLIFGILVDLFRQRAAMEAEILVL